MDHFKSVIEGPGGVVGIMVAAGGAVLVGNRDLIIQGAIVAAEITHTVIISWLAVSSRSFGGIKPCKLIVVLITTCIHFSTSIFWFDHMFIIL